MVLNREAPRYPISSPYWPRYYCYYLWEYYYDYGIWHLSHVFALLNWIPCDFIAKYPAFWFPSQTVSIYLSSLWNHSMIHKLLIHLPIIQIISSSSKSTSELLRPSLGDSFKSLLTFMSLPVLACSEILLHVYELLLEFLKNLLFVLSVMASILFLWFLNPIWWHFKLGEEISTHLFIVF